NSCCISGARMFSMKKRALVLFAMLWMVCLAANAEPIVVASDGSGAFKTVQAAIDSIPEVNTEPRTIVIKPGTYKERIILKGKNFVALKGDDADATKTLLTWNRHAGMDDPDAPGKKVGTTGSESVLINANDFYAENITFENSAGEVGQAVAVLT